MESGYACAMQKSSSGEKPTGSPDERPANEGRATNHWWVYMIRCDDGSLYTGVSTDPERRFQEHLQHPRGAKYFNGRLPAAIVYTESGHTRSSACHREAAIKKLDRRQKQLLVSDQPTARSG
jgi:putative endonuclease